MKPYFVVAGMMLAALGSVQADTFRWVDKSGKVHYGDKPAEEAVQVEKKKFGVAPEMEGADLPYETRRAQQNFPVTLYLSGNCEPCQQARDFLKKRGIPYAEKNLETKEDIDAYKQMPGGGTVPALSVGKTWLKGFLAEQWSAELDAAGYPKTVAPRPPAPPTPPPPSEPQTKNQPSY